jgi:TctA family transporter
MIFGWNRLVLCAGFLYGRQLEESLRHSFVLSEGKLSVFLDRPPSQLHMALAFTVLAIAFALWLWRVMRLPKPAASN